MQKVSKQSLAMIALSILLAISIALTFTFAALQDSKTATGTITFSGEVGITISSADSVVTVSQDGTAITISGITDSEKLNSALKDVKIAVSSNSVAAALKVTISDVTGTNAAVISEWTRKTSEVTSNSNKVTVAGTGASATFTTEKLAANGYILLGDLVTAAVNLSNIASDDTTANAQFTITVDASASGTFTA